MKIIEAHKRAHHSKPGPKRDRLLRYLKDLVNEDGIKVLSHKRLQLIANLYELPDCVFRECTREAVRYAKRIELIKQQLKAT